MGVGGCERERVMLVLVVMVVRATAGCKTQDADQTRVGHATGCQKRHKSDECEAGKATVAL